jgi:proline-rich tail region repeat protein
MVGQDDGPATGGRDFLRAMADQSARHHDFNRRMRWFWLRRRLVDGSGPEAPAAPAEPDHDLTIDLRPTVVPAVPHQRS